MGTKTWKVHKGRQQREGNKLQVFSFPVEQTRHGRVRKLQSDNENSESVCIPPYRD